MIWHHCHLLSRIQSRRPRNLAAPLLRPRRGLMMASAQPSIRISTTHPGSWGNSGTTRPTQFVASLLTSLGFYGSPHLGCSAIRGVANMYNFGFRHASPSAFTLGYPRSLNVTFQQPSPRKAPSPCASLAKALLSVADANRPSTLVLDDPGYAGPMACNVSG